MGLAGDWACYDWWVLPMIGFGVLRWRLVGFAGDFICFGWW